MVELQDANRIHKPRDNSTPVALSTYCTGRESQLEEVDRSGFHFPGLSFVRDFFCSGDSTVQRFLITILAPDLLAHPYWLNREVEGIIGSLSNFDFIDYSQRLYADDNN